jgi:predicted peptidase
MPRLVALASFALLTIGCRDAGATREAEYPFPAATLPAGQAGFVGRTLVDSGVAYRYQVFVPAGLTDTSRPPVILYLHGNSEKGTDGDRQTRSGLGPVVRERAATFPAVVVFPQSPDGSFPRIHRRFGRIASRMLDATIAELHADTSRVYLTGVSYGSIIGWELVHDAPERFAAFVPIASKNMCCIVGGSADALEAVDTALVARVRHVPIWQFRGAADTIGSAQGTRNFAAAMRAAGAPYRLTEVPGHAHVAWDVVYADSATYAWLFAQRRR